MVKTIKEIADELGLDKQKVYRYIKKEHINEVHHEAHHEALQKSSVKQYDEVAQSIIKQGLLRKSTSSEAHHEAHHEVLQKHINDVVSDALIDMLRKELESKNQQLVVKDQQIEELNLRLAECNAALVTAQQMAQAAQALHAGTIRQQLTVGEDDPDTRGQNVKSQAEKKSWVVRLLGK